jgi:hypothetical protein
VETDAPQRGGVAKNIDLEYVTPVSERRDGVARATGSRLEV